MNTETTNVEVVSEDKKLIDALKKCATSFPASIPVSRNNVTDLPPLGVQKYNRGDKKEFGCTFLGFPEELFSEKGFAQYKDKLFAFTGEDRIRALLRNFWNTICQKATEAACETGVFQLDQLLKGVQEISYRGETIKELEEGLKECTVRMQGFDDACKANPQYFMSPEGRAVFKEVMDDIRYYNEALARKKNSRASAE